MVKKKKGGGRDIQITNIKNEKILQTLKIKEDKEFIPIN